MRRRFGCGGVRPDLDPSNRDMDAGFCGSVMIALKRQITDLLQRLCPPPRLGAQQ